MSKKNKTPNLIEGRTKEYNEDRDYYNRKSIDDSYTIAVICMFAIVIILGVLGVFFS
jgi:hypothetical protein